MASRTRLSILASLALAASLPQGACVYEGGHGSPGAQVIVANPPAQHGPPPHAPAYGYRRKQHVENGPDLELAFDSGLGVYVVVGIPDLYFLDGHYFRFADSGWQISVHHDSGWTVAVQSDVPSALWKSKAGNGKKIPPGQAKKAGAWPAKHGNAQGDED